MSFHRERIQGAGAIAAAARPSRSAPSKIVRTRRALGDMQGAQACRLTFDTVRMPDGSVVKVNYRSVTSMPWCPGVTPSAPTPSPGPRTRTAAFSTMVSNTLLPVLATTNAIPQQPSVGGGGGTPSSNGSGMTTHPTSTPPTAPTLPTQPPPSAPPLTVSTPVAPPPLVVTLPGTNVVGPKITVVAPSSPAAPTPYVPGPTSTTIDTSVLTSPSPSPRKVPWLWIGLGAVGLVVLLRK